MFLLVTGCSSYIGKRIAERLLHEGHVVVGVCRRDPQIDESNFLWIEGDLLHCDCVPEKHFDCVVHCAGEGWYGKNVCDYVRSNVVLTERLIEQLLDSPPEVLFYTSSTDVYGDVSGETVDESTPICNPGPYGLSKYMAEQMLASVFPTISFRLPAILGVGSHGWIMEVYRRLVRGDTVELFDREFNNAIFVDDVAAAVSVFLDTSPPVGAYNLASSGSMASLDIVKKMKKTLGSESDIRLTKKGVYKSFLVGTDKVERYYKPFGIEKTLECFIDDLLSG